MIVKNQMRVFLVLFGLLLFQLPLYSIDKKMYSTVKSGVLLVGVCVKQIDLSLLSVATKEAIIRKFGKAKYTVALAKLKHAKRLQPYCKQFRTNKKMYFYRLRSTGSSFLVNRKGNLITNYHVVGNYPNIVVFDANESGANAKIAKVVWSSKDHDLAILKVSGLSTARKPLILASPSLINKLVDSDVWSLGYPGVSNTSAVNLISFQAKSDKGVIRAKPEQRYLMGNKTVSTSTIEHSAYINSGNSGGPLVDHCGKVLGVNQSVPSIKRGQGIGWSVHIKHVVDGLKANGIQFKSSSKICPYYTSGPASTSSILNYFVIALLLLLTTMVVWLYKKRNAKPEGLTKFMRREMSRYFKGSSRTSDCNDDKNQEASRKTELLAVLEGYGTLAGIKYELSGEGEVVIGRDNVGLVVPVDSIGRKHACLYWQAHMSVIWIEDLNSTNGTFLENGDQVNPGEKAFLKFGESFYLAEPENGFRLIEK